MMIYCHPQAPHFHKTHEGGTPDLLSTRSRHRRWIFVAVLLEGDHLYWRQLQLHPNSLPLLYQGYSAAVNTKTLFKKHTV